MSNISAYALGHGSYPFGDANPFPEGSSQWWDFLAGANDARLDGDES